MKLYLKNFNLVVLSHIMLIQKMFKSALSHFSQFVLVHIMLIQKGLQFMYNFADQQKFVIGDIRGTAITICENKPF